MARNDGKDYSVARNGKYTRSKIGNIERHNERKNQLYQNTDIELDRSHASENSIRPLTLDRKNWMFSDSQDGANASMIVYTMVEMAKAHGLHPYNYLKYVLDSCPGTTDFSCVFHNFYILDDIALHCLFVMLKLLYEQQKTYKNKFS